MSQSAEEMKQKKVPTPKKRHKQDQKKRLFNKYWKSRVKSIKASFTKLKTEEEKANSLQLFYSFVDKAMKSGVFHKNRASRLKSRFAQKFH